MALIVLVSCLLVGCATASNSPQQLAELSPRTQLSSDPYPNTATRGYIVCGQPAAMPTRACQDYRYSDFGGAFK